MSAVRTPVTLLTGSLGSGKTTLLRHVLEERRDRIAILMNEFGEMAIDSRIVEGRNIQIAELDGGCVCCSLLGEFEVAVKEILETVDPDILVVETTGVAEPDALVFDMEESLPQVRLDGVVTVVDAAAMVEFPQLGQTTRMQIEAADTMLLNKIDLVPEHQLREIEKKLRQLNRQAPVLRTERCRVDCALLFGLGRNREAPPPRIRHQLEFGVFSYSSHRTFDRGCFEIWADHLDAKVYRAKGFVCFEEGTALFNFVAGRWELENFGAEETALVFIGRDLESCRGRIIADLEKCGLEG